MHALYAHCPFGKPSKPNACIWKMFHQPLLFCSGIDFLLPACYEQAVIAEGSSGQTKEQQRVLMGFGHIHRPSANMFSKIQGLLESNTSKFQLKVLIS